MKKIQAGRVFDGFRFLDNNPVIVFDDDKIIDMISPEQVGDDVMKINGVLCPAWVNTHCHLELSHLKNTIPSHQGISNFLQQVVAQRNLFTETDILFQAQLQDQKMYQSGISLVGDICNQPITIPIKKKSKIKYHSFIEILGLFPELSEQKYNDGIALKQAFSEQQLNATLVPHAPYSVCMDLFLKIGNTLSNDIVSMHYHESQDEIEWMIKHEGGIKRFYDFLKFSVPPYDIVLRNEWAKAFDKNKHFIVVHNVYATEEDIATLNKYFIVRNISLFLCLCPQANNYIQQKMPPYFLWEKYVEKLCIGTDSLASNTELNILAELQLLQQYYPQIPLSHLLRAATCNGAKALGMEHTFGSIAKGKSSQLIVLENLEDNKLNNAVVRRVEVFF